MKPLFWMVLVVLVYGWLIYPLLLRIVALVVARNRKFLHPNRIFSISIIIAAHDEENNIARRIENLMKLDYPKDQIEIIVASDGSTDRTNDIVKEISAKNKTVILLPFEEQKGRAYVHNQSVKKAQGNILIFTDAQTVFDRDFLNYILPHFSDPRVGAVSGRIYYLNEGESTITKSAGIYWKYEEYLRKLESDLDLLAVGSGATLAMRREVYKPLYLTEDIDYAATINAKLMGYSVRYEPMARAFDYISSSIEKVHKTRIRQTSRAFKSIFLRWIRISPLRYPRIFVSIYSHKLSRHLTPFYMILIFILNAFLLSKGALYQIIFFFQIVFYTFALIGWILEKWGIRIFILNIPFNFCLLNSSRFLGVIKSISGKEVSIYRSTV